MKPFEYHEPTTLAAASDLLARYGRGALPSPVELRCWSTCAMASSGRTTSSACGRFPGSTGCTSTAACTSAHGDGHGTRRCEPLIRRCSGCARRRACSDPGRSRTWPPSGGNLCKASPGRRPGPAAALPRRSARASRLDGRTPGPAGRFPDRAGPDRPTTGRTPHADPVEPPPARTGTSFLKIMRRQGARLRHRFSLRTGDPGGGQHHLASVPGSGWPRWRPIQIRAPAPRPRWRASGWMRSTIATAAQFGAQPKPNPSTCGPTRRLPAANSSRSCSERAEKTGPLNAGT